MAAPGKQPNLKLSVSDFGPIARADIDLRPLTLFIGPSNTGKSYLAIMIYALHKLFDGHMQEYMFRSRFSNIRTDHRRHDLALADNSIESHRRSYASVIEWLDSVEPTTESLGLARALPDEIASLVRPLLQDDLSLSETLSVELARCFGTSNLARLVRRGSRKSANVSLTRPALDNSEKYESFTYGLSIGKKRVQDSVSVPDSTPLPLGGVDDPQLIDTVTHLRSLVKSAQIEMSGNFFYDFILDYLAQSVGASILSPFSNSAHYLPADRTGVMHSHQVVVASIVSGAPTAGLIPGVRLPTLSGVLSDFLTQLIRLDTETNGNGSPGIKLADTIEAAMLKGSIRSDRSPTDYPVFYYRPDGWADDLPLMGSSSMVSEIAPVVLYLRYVAQPGDVLIIEEPESHLHPAMQVEFIRQLAAVVKAGIRVVLTTHSEWVLEELANLVRLSDLDESDRAGIDGADSALRPADVGAWMFEPKTRPRGSVVREIPLDMEEGGFDSGFDAVARLTYNNWAKISNRIERRRVK